MHDGVFFSVTDQWILFFSVGQTFVIVAYTTREAIEACRTDFPIFTDDNTTNLCRWIFAPPGEVLGQVKKTLIPLVAHWLTNPLTAVLAIIASPATTGVHRWCVQSIQANSLASKGNLG